MSRRRPRKAVAMSRWNSMFQNPAADSPLWLNPSVLRTLELQPAAPEGSEKQSMVDTSTILTHFKYLLSSGLHSDFKLVVGCEELAVHRCILAARSAVFAKLMDDAESQERITGRHEIQDIDFEVVCLMAEFMYGGDLKDPCANVALQLYHVSQRYEMDDMKDLCVKFLNLDMNNVCDVLVAGKLYEDQGLLKDARKFFFENIKTVQKSQKWKNVCNEHRKFAFDLYKDYVEIVHILVSNKKVNNSGSGFFVATAAYTDSKGCSFGAPAPPALLTSWFQFQSTTRQLPARSATILGHFRGLLDRGLHSDFKLVVGCEELAVHRCVLAARSPVFATMLQHEMREAITGRLEIKDTDFEVVRRMVEFLYSGRLDNLSQSVALQLYHVSQTYQLDDMKNVCVKYLNANLEVGNVCDVLAAGNLYDESSILLEAKQFVFRNIAKIQKTDDWNELYDEQPELVLAVYEEYVETVKTNP